MMSDFAIEIIDGHPVQTWDETDSLLPEIILSLHIKARSTERNTQTGQPVYPGDWYMFPDFGQTLYEIATTREEDVAEAQTRTYRALRWLLESRRAKRITAAASKSGAHTIQIQIEVVDRDDRVVTYTHWHKVG
jgi:phage gp46-like protein